MTTWYFDSVNGLDANNGTSPNTPKKYYNNISFGSLANGDTFLFKRGTTQVITTAYTQVRSGNSDSVRSRYAVYGESDTNYCIWTNPTGVGTMVLNMAGTSYVDIEDMRFDAGRMVNNAIYAAVQGAGNVVGHRFYRCHFKNANGSGVNVGIEGGKTGTPSGFVFEDCDFYNNGAHGLILSGANNCSVRYCRFYENGDTGAFGGHGFSAGAGKTEVTSGWTNTSGTIYSRPLAANETSIYYVRTNTALYQRLRLTAGVQTAPGIGEFGVSGTTLYINANVNANTITVVYAWKRAHTITVEGCVAYDNIWNQAAPFHEGHGFAFDDFTDDSFFIGNKSFNNQGAGFSLNRGDRNTLIGNIAYGNWQAAVVINPCDDTQIVHNTFYNNNTGTGAHTAEIAANGYCKDAVISNNILVSTKEYGISRETTDTGFSGVTNCIHGFITAAEKNASVTSTISVDPQLDFAHRPNAVEVQGTGTPLGGTDAYGKTFSSAPNVGAVERISSYIYRLTRGL